MTLPQPFPTHEGRCLAIWDTEQGEYRIACVCTPQELKELARLQQRDQQKKREEDAKRERASLYRQPFRLLR